MFDHDQRPSGAPALTVEGEGRGAVLVWAFSTGNLLHFAGEPARPLPSFLLFFTNTAPLAKWSAAQLYVVLLDWVAHTEWCAVCQESRGRPRRAGAG